MKWLAKNWWMILLLIGGAVILYMLLSKKKPAPTTTTTNGCSQYLDLISDTEDNIDSTASWRAQVEAKLDEQNHSCYGKTYEQCRKSEAIYALKTNGYMPATCFA